MSERVTRAFQTSMTAKQSTASCGTVTVREADDGNGTTDPPGNGDNGDENGDNGDGGGVSTRALAVGAGAVGLGGLAYLRSRRN